MQSPPSADGERGRAGADRMVNNEPECAKDGLGPQLCRHAQRHDEGVLLGDAKAQVLRHVCHENLEGRDVDGRERRLGWLAAPGRTQGRDLLHMASGEREGQLPVADDGLLQNRYEKRGGRSADWPRGFKLGRWLGCTVGNRVCSRVPAYRSWQRRRSARTRKPLGPPRPSRFPVSRHPPKKTKGQNEFENMTPKETPKATLKVTFHAGLPT